MGLSVGLWPTADGRFCESSAAPPVAGFACVLPSGLRLQAQCASRTLLVDRLPAMKKAPPATCLNLRFNQVGLRSRLRNLWFRTSRRACRRQRLKLGALPPPNPRQVSQGTISDHLRSRSTMVADPRGEAACRHKSSKNGSRWRTRFAESTVASRPKADRQSKGLSPLPQRGPSAVFPVTISGPPRSGVARVGGFRRTTPTIGL